MTTYNTIEALREARQTDEHLVRYCSDLCYNHFMTTPNGIEFARLTTKLDKPVDLDAPVALAKRYYGDLCNEIVANLTTKLPAYEFFWKNKQGGEFEFQAKKKVSSTLDPGTKLKVQYAANAYNARMNLIVVDLTEKINAKFGAGNLNIGEIQVEYDEREEILRRLNELYSTAGFKVIFEDVRDPAEKVKWEIGDECIVSVLGKEYLGKVHGYGESPNYMVMVPLIASKPMSVDPMSMNPVPRKDLVRVALKRLE